MEKILFPVDGSDHAVRAAEFLVSSRAKHAKAGELELHLLNVQTPLPSLASQAAGADRVRQHHHDEGLEALKRVRAVLDAAGVAYVFHIGVGEPAEVIASYVKDKGCGEVVMGTRGLGSVSSMVLGSVATKVIHLASVPVTLVK